MWQMVKIVFIYWVVYLSPYRGMYEVLVDKVEGQIYAD